MKLIPFESQPDLVEAVKNGIAVQVILKVDQQYEKSHRDHYHNCLGFDGSEHWKFCTILSEIKNMPGHYVVVGSGNKIVSGLHGDIFYIDEEDKDDWK